MPCQYICLVNMAGKYALKICLAALKNYVK